MRNVDVETRVSELEHRVERIERRLEMNAVLRTAAEQRAERVAEVVPDAAVPSAAPSAQNPSEELQALFGKSRQARGFAPPPAAPSQHAVTSTTPLPLPPPLPITPAPVKELPMDSNEPSPVLAYRSIPAPLPPPRQRELEQTIGVRWAGWVGAVVLVIGAGLWIKYIYDQGWFAVLPATLRLGVMTLGSFTLIGAGEWVRRKVSDAAAVGLFGSGVATLFLVAYAGHGYLGLYQPQTAFVLMGLSTLIGAAVAMRGRMVSIAVLALIGGNLAPVVLHTDVPQPVPFLAYVLMLQLVSLALSWWGGEKRWQMLRWISLATTSFWTAGLLARHLVGATTPITVFTLVYAALYHVELICSTLKVARNPADANSVHAQAIAAATFSAVVTSLTTLLLLFVTRGDTALVRGMWVTLMSVVCGGAGTAIALWRRDVLRPLAVSLRVQSAALLVLAVPVAFTGGTVSLAWGGLAIAFVAIGAKLDIRPLRAASIVTWVLALGNLVLWAPNTPSSSTTWLTLFGTDLPIGWANAALLALIGQIIAWTMPRTRNDATAGETLKTSRSIAAVATLVFIVVSTAYLPTLSATIAIVALAWWLVLSDRLDTRIGWLVQAAAVLGIATLKWAVVDTISQRLAPSWSATAYLPVLNPLTGTGMLISASLLGMFLLRRATWMRMLSTDGDDGANDRAPLAALVAVVCGLVTLALTFDVDRVVQAVAVRGLVGGWPMWQVKQMAWTMLWSAAALGTTTFASRLLPLDRRAAWHRAGAGIVSLLAIKFLVIDTFVWRLLDGVTAATMVANVQTLAAALVVGALIAAVLIIRGDAESGPARRFIGFLAVLVIVWTGSLEIDRIFETLARTKAGPFGDPHLAKQVALSIFWSIFAISSVVAGFRLRVVGLRYLGLALFGLTLLKVVIVDLDGATRGYRILSFMGLGLLLLGTSVLYGKLSPKLLREAA